MDATFEWDDQSAADLEEAFRDLGDVLISNLESAGQDIGVRIRGDAQQNAPADRGRLQSSLESSVVQVGIDVVRIVVGTNVDHAEPIEKGTDPFFPPPSELRGWAKRVLGDADAAFAVAQSISESGIDEHRYLADAFEANIEWAMDQIAQAIQNSFEEVGLA